MVAQKGQTQTKKKTQIKKKNTHWKNKTVKSKVENANEKAKRK